MKNVQSCITNDNCYKYKLEEIAILMASKFDSLNDFLEDGDYAKRFSGALNKLEKIEYVTSYILQQVMNVLNLIKYFIN